MKPPAHFGDFHRLIAGDYIVDTTNAGYSAVSEQAAAEKMDEMVVAVKMVAQVAEILADEFDASPYHAVSVARRVCGALFSAFVQPGSTVLPSSSDNHQMLLRIAGLRSH